MEQIKTSRLALIMLLFAGVAVLSIATSFAIFEINTSLIKNMLFTLLSGAVIAWAAISGKKIGVGTIPAISAWVYAGAHVIFALYAVVQIIAINTDVNIPFATLTAIVNLLGFLSFISLVLFVVLSRVWLPLKITTAAILFLEQIGDVMWIFNTDFMIEYRIAYQGALLALWLPVLALSIVWFIIASRRDRATA